MRGAHIMPNDDGTVTIRIDPAPEKKDKGEPFCCSEDLTATAPNFEEGLKKLSEMYKIKVGKSQSPREALENYFEI